MGRGVADHGKLESGGWKGKAGTAIHASNAQGRYYTQIMQAFSRKGEACIYRYWFNKTLVASDLFVYRNRTMICLKIAYDESQQTHAPNILMREAEFRHIFKTDSFDRIEFYGRTMYWHTKWSNEFRTLFHVNCYRWPFLSKLHQWIGSRQTPTIRSG
jgi:hypothetical protein